MPPKKTEWKKGRGRLGPLNPLLGVWEAAAESPMGKVRCTRTFQQVLGATYVQLDAIWDFGNKQYVEHALFGVQDGTIVFWSFTSDGKHSSGKLVEAADIHPEAIAFEAEMPAGTARMVYWPAEQGFHWAVESKNKKGWNRFTLHHYRRKQ